MGVYQGVLAAAQGCPVERPAWLTLGVMFGLSALYAIFLVPWLFWSVILLGSLAVGGAIGTGLGLNMREH